MEAVQSQDLLDHGTLRGDFRLTGSLGYGSLAVVANPIDDRIAACRGGGPAMSGWGSREMCVASERESQAAKLSAISTHPTAKTKNQ